MAAPGSAVSKVRNGVDAWVITLAGAGLPVATELHAELEDVLGAGARSVVVDLADATPVDLTVVGVLLASLRRLNDADGQLVLVAPDDGELRVAHDALRLRDHFRVERTLPAAVAASGAGGAR
jgi:anti-anti-sigma regulatory factor